MNFRALFHKEPWGREYSTSFVLSISFPSLLVTKVSLFTLPASARPYHWSWILLCVGGWTSEGGGLFFLIRLPMQFKHLKIMILNCSGRLFKYRSTLCYRHLTPLDIGGRQQEWLLGPMECSSLLLPLPSLSSNSNHVVGGCYRAYVFKCATGWKHDVAWMSSSWLMRNHKILLRGYPAMC